MRVKVILSSLARCVSTRILDIEYGIESSDEDVNTVKMKCRIFDGTTHDKSILKTRENVSTLLRNLYDKSSVSY